MLARNIDAVLDGRPPQPFVYATLGMMGSLGHGKAFGQLLKVRVHGVVAWFEGVSGGGGTAMAPAAPPPPPPAPTAPTA